MTQLRRDEPSASAWAQSNGFTGDPLNSPIAGRYYGYLTHVDGY
jgi:hypothetical protein